VIPLLTPSSGEIWLWVKSLLLCHQTLEEKVHMDILCGEQQQNIRNLLLGDIWGYTAALNMWPTWNGAFPISGFPARHAHYSGCESWWCLSYLFLWYHLCSSAIWWKFKSWAMKVMMLIWCTLLFLHQELTLFSAWHSRTSALRDKPSSDQTHHEGW